MPKSLSRKVRLSEIEAAIAVSMSPRLLRWFTEHPAKQGESRKLPCEKEDGEYFYDKNELLAFHSKR